MDMPVESLRCAAAQEALRDMVHRVTTLLRTNPDPRAPAVGEWTLGEVAMHLSQAWLVVPSLARGGLARVVSDLPSPSGTAGQSLIRDMWDLAEVTKLGVASDPERDLRVLADRIDERAAEFFTESIGTSGHERRPWLVDGVIVARSVLTCHLLNETVMHGGDIAAAAGAKWSVDRPYAAIVLGGFLVEVIRALDPRALVDQRRAAGLRATYDIRVRGGDRFTFVFDDGELHVEQAQSRRVDCHLSADPAALLVVAWARKSQWPAIATGRLVAWGTKPWLGPRFRSLMRNP